MFLKSFAPNDLRHNISPTFRNNTKVYFFVISDQKNVFRPGESPIPYFLEHLNRKCYVTTFMKIEQALATFVYSQ